MQNVADRKSKAIVRDGQWGHAYQLGSGETQRHDLSETRLWLTLLDREWQIRTEKLPRSEERSRWTESLSLTLPGSGASLQRFIRPDESGTVTFLPALAGLPTVIRPYEPLTIPPQGECTIYVGTLVWMRVCVGSQLHELAELPLAAQNMTWVGSNTMEGDVCYSAPTHARLMLEAVPKRPWRAISPVLVRNHRKVPLLLERFSLPTPLLGIYRNTQGQLWTSLTTVTCETGMNAARLKVDSTVPVAAGEAELLSAPREKAERGGLIRTVDRMFG